MKINSIAFLALVFLYFCGVNSHAAPLTFATQTIEIQTNTGKREYKVELAKTPEQQQLGLMYRQHLDKKRGMLFLFKTNAPIRMWMKNTFISLDMFFFDPMGRIIYIAENTTPESATLLGTDKPVRAVLELGGGAAKKYGIKVGDTLSHPHFEMRR